jgi:hypothetical protein
MAVVEQVVQDQALPPLARQAASALQVQAALVVSHFALSMQSR